MDLESKDRVDKRNPVIIGRVETNLNDDVKTHVSLPEGYTIKKREGKKRRRRNSSTNE